MTEIQQDREPVEQQTPTWRPLSPVERRIAGVLVEKAKTTPDSYPLSLNALTTGCNQKSNRSPQMNIDTDDVEEAIEILRTAGAVGVIQGGGRVVKYRHYMKEWLAVDGIELAVMAELLLRGTQTVGELRGRAARMASISDMGELRPILQSLMTKRLVVALTAEGRGQIVTHGLFASSELDRLRREYGHGEPTASTRAEINHPPAATPSHLSTGPTAPPATATSPTVPPGHANPTVNPTQEIAALKQAVESLKHEVIRLSQKVDNLNTNHSQ